MKKLLSTIIAIVMIVTCAGALAEVSAPGEFPITDEKLELTVFYVPATNVEDIETNYATQWLENKTGIHVNWITSTVEDAASKISLMLTSGQNLPDIFLVKNITADMINAYGMQGMLLNLDDYINEYGFYCKDIWEKIGNNAQNVCKAADGHNYYLPRYATSTHGSCDNKMWMNYKWLENLGLQPPTTIDEFYEVLKAFKEQDANGNGDPNDEIPLAYGVNGWANQCPTFIMSSFVFWFNASTAGNTYRYIEDDGKVHVSYYEDGFREGLKFLNKLYTEGLMDPESFLLTDPQIMALAADEKGCRIGCFTGGYANSVIAATDPQVFDYHTVEPLTGPTGLKQVASTQLNPDPRAFISVDTKHPVEAFRWCEALMQDLAGMLDEGNYEWMDFFYGPEGEGWRKAEEGEMGLAGTQAAYAWLFDFGQNSNMHWYEEFPCYMPRSYKNYMAVSAAEGYDLEKVLYDETIANYDAYRAEKILPPLSLDEDQATTISEMDATLTPFMEEYMAKFVTGVLDPNDDAAWEQYKADLQEIGIDDYIAILQAGYDAMINA